MLAPPQPSRIELALQAGAGVSSLSFFSLSFRSSFFVPLQVSAMSWFLGGSLHSGLILSQHI